MTQTSGSFLLALREHLKLAVADLGIVISPEAIERDLTSLELRATRILTDVELARVQRVPLFEAVHAHELFPHLARAHGSLRDALLQRVPNELLPLARGVLRKPPPEWALDFRNDLCIVARGELAEPIERALCRLLLFEGLWFNLFIAAWRMNGGFEGLGAGGRDLERVASDTLDKLLAVPLDEDAADPFRPYETSVAAALLRLEDHLRSVWQRQIDRFASVGTPGELLHVFELRAAAEMKLRRAHPITAALLRNELEADRAEHLQPIPVGRLPLEHPLLLGDFNETSLNTRASRARERLLERPATMTRRDSLTFADLFAELEAEDA